MRRITAKYARTGMILGMSVYNNFGKEILGYRTTLDNRALNTMEKSHVGEIFIEDERSDDIVVAPAVSLGTEGKLTSVFRQFLSEIKDTGYADDSNILAISAAVNEIVNDIQGSILGEINVSCFVSEEDYACVHPVKSAVLAMTLGQKLGMSTVNMATLGLGALFQDISLFCAPQAISNSGHLTPEDPETMQNHPINSYEYLKKTFDINSQVTQAILQHHESWNGNGYPRGLKEEQISIFAQIIAIAEAFSDLLTVQSGKPRYMSHEAIEFVMANSGDQFNPELVEAFIRKIPSYPTGLTVKLNSGEVGIIADSNLGFVARPVVRICFDLEHGNLKRPYDINLARSQFQTKLISKILEYD